MKATAVIDACGYVLPAAELLYERAVGPLRGHWPALGDRLALTLPTPGIGDWDSCYTRFVSNADIGHAAAGSRPTPSPLPRSEPQRRDFLEARILHDNARGRLRAMDRLGIDVQVLHPAGGLDTLTELEAPAAALLFNAYNNYITTYCETDPRRLKAVLQLHPLAAEWAEDELTWWASHPGVAGVGVHLPAHLPADSPELVRVCEAVAKAGLPLFQRAGCCAAAWSPPAFVSFLQRHGLLQRHPGLLVALVGWPRDRLSDWVSMPWPVATAGTAARILMATDAPVAAGEPNAATLWGSGFPFDAPGLPERIAAIQASAFGARDAERLLAGQPATISAMPHPASVAYAE